MLLLDLCFCPLSIFLEVSHYVSMISKCSGLVLKACRHLHVLVGASRPTSPLLPSDSFPKTYFPESLLAHPTTILSHPCSPTTRLTHLTASPLRQAANPQLLGLLNSGTQPRAGYAGRFGAENQCFGAWFCNPPRQEAAAQTQTSFLQLGPDTLSAGSKCREKTLF